MGLRFGLLGTGYWAEETHGAGLATHAGVDFVGVWGRSEVKTSALASRYGVTAYQDVDALLADVDAVAVALPPDIQADLALRAALAGKHLLLDKPLALETRAADRVVDAVTERGLSSVLFFTMRFQPKITEFLDTTVAAGQWDGARATQFASIFQPGNPYGSSVWRQEKGGLWDIAPHSLSVVTPVLGPVERVAAMAGPHGVTHLLLSHVNGAASTVSVTLDSPPAGCLRGLVFFGEPGVATMPDGDLSAVDAFGGALTELVRDVRAGTTTHPCDVRYGRHVVAVLEAAQTALREERVVTVPS